MMNYGCYILLNVVLAMIISAVPQSLEVRKLISVMADSPRSSILPKKAIDINI